MRCLAVDDEPLALEIMQAYISKVPFLHLVASCQTGLEAYDYLAKDQIDLIFLDINMPDLSGIEFLKTLSYRPLIIFTTAYENYALEGFNLDAVDYLLKPIPFERFLKAVNKAAEIDSLKKHSNLKQTEMKRDFLFVRADYQLLKVNFSDIFYIEGFKDYIKIYTSSEKPIFTINSLKKIEEKLSNGDFIRIHRSFLISISKIQALQKNRVKIKDKFIPIGDLYRDSFLKLINAQDQEPPE